VRELLRYARLQLGDGCAPNGERLLSLESVQAMRQPLVPSTGLPDRAVGLAWNIGPSNISHGGATHGQRGFLMVSLERGITLATLANAPIGDQVTWRAVRYVGAELLKLPAPAPTPEIPVDASTLETCVGLYVAPTRHIEVGRLGEALVLREIPRGGFPKKDSPPLPGPPPPPMRFGFYAKDRLVGLDPPNTEARAEIIRDDDGSVKWLRYFGRLHRHVSPDRRQP
jgi:hypothetical protein